MMERTYYHVQDGCLTEEGDYAPAAAALFPPPSLL